MAVRSIGLALGGLFLCASVAVADTQERSVPAFSRIESRGSAGLEVRVGGSQSVRVEGEENLERVTTTVRGDTLVIAFRNDRNYSYTNSPIRIIVSVPRLSALAVSGSGDAQVDGLREGKFALSISGSGGVTAAGTTDRLDVSIAGSGEANLTGLRSRTASVSVAGSGDVRVYASEVLTASVAGSGDIFYTGNPRRVDRSTVGSGSIRSQ